MEPTNTFFPKQKGLPADIKAQGYLHLLTRLHIYANTYGLGKVQEFFLWLIIGAIFMASSVATTDISARVALFWGGCIATGISFYTMFKSNKTMEEYTKTIQAVETEMGKFYLDTYGELPPMNPNPKAKKPQELLDYIKRKEDIEELKREGLVHVHKKDGTRVITTEVKA